MHGLQTVVPLKNVSKQLVWHKDPFAYFVECGTKCDIAIIRINSICVQVIVMLFVVT